MSRILHIETSTGLCSIALSENGVLINESVGSGQQSHIAILMPMIDELMMKTGWGKSTLDAVAVSAGPGSYTGLRIGVSTAKGLCYGLDIPLIATDSLEIVASAVHRCVKPQPNEWIIPMIDARRMEVFASVYDHELKLCEASKAIIIEENSFSNYDGQRIYLAGDGAMKLKSIFSNRQDFVFIEEQFHLARNGVASSFQKFQSKNFTDVAYFEPGYGKQYIAALPVVKGLR